ncbi:MAG: beta-mannosidase [Bacteroidaceae bacterium]|nr:beta-mannosidase [Bacteroidaceae bacterium]
MKRILSLFTITLLSTSLLHSTPLPTREGQRGGSASLLTRLHALLARGYMFGHQDDPFYGTSWEWERGRSDVLESCGDYPAVMGFDLGGIEVGDAKNLDSVPFTRIREELLAHVRRGGIVTVSWHPRNPLTGGTAWDVSDSTVVRSILPGGTMHRKFLLWMKNVSAFLRSLKDDEGRAVPIIFRPLHENNGSWFWWGKRLCTAEEYKALWCTLQDHLLADGLDNLVWSWSPNLGIASPAPNPSPLPREGQGVGLEAFNTYPGDDRVDLLGLDAYQWGTEQEFVTQLNADLTVLTAFAAERDKLFALTECGLKNLPDPTWWTRVLKPQTDKYPISYFLVWRNAKHEFFAPVPGTQSATYFREMIKSKNILMLKDIAPLPTSPEGEGH